MFDQAAIGAFLLEAARARNRVVLITVLGGDGPPLRRPGSLLAVTQDGRFAGSLSSGCIEQAVIGEAMKAIEGKDVFEVRFGCGSPYIDIRLPCGGGVDLLFCLISDFNLLRRIGRMLGSRDFWQLNLPRSSGGRIAIARSAHRVASLSMDHDLCRINGVPGLNLVALGDGEAIAALSRLSQAMGIVGRFARPDSRLRQTAWRRDDADYSVLSLPSDLDALKLDPATAVVLLVHDHDWEIPLLAKALDGPAFYVGAMGGRSTVARRIMHLQDAGFSPAQISRIHSPIGMIARARDPEVLAVSALAEIVAAYDRTFLGDGAAPTEDAE